MREETETAVEKGKVWSYILFFLYLPPPSSPQLLTLMSRRHFMVIEQSLKLLPLCIYRAVQCTMYMHTWLAGLGYPFFLWGMSPGTFTFRGLYNEKWNWKLHGGGKLKILLICMFAKLSIGENICRVCKAITEKGRGKSIFFFNIGAAAAVLDSFGCHRWPQISAIILLLPVKLPETLIKSAE